MSPQVDLDLKGVPCPLNFIKIRLKMEELQTGDTLGVVIDDGEPIDSVPHSLQAEGFEVLEQEIFEKDYWFLMIKK